jgi:hypothetical protein
MIPPWILKDWERKAYFPCYTFLIVVAIIHNLFKRAVLLKGPGYLIQRIDMSKQERPNDFETQWQRKLAQAIESLAGTESADKVMAGGDKLQDPSTSREKLLWTCEALEILAETADESTRQEILTRCHCHYPPEDLQEEKALYQDTGDLDLVLAALQSKFERFLHDTLKLEDNLVEDIVRRGWGLAGVRKGNQIIATKIPKSGSLREYFQADDPLEKQRLYCHCPRVRDQIGSDPTLPEEYCYCGAGFYRGIWEEIIGEPVQVEVLESVMTGGEVCRIGIKLHN